LLAEEKAATKMMSDLAAKRRQLPMVKVENPDKIDFTVSDGSKKSLLDLFGDRRQLILYDFLLHDEDEAGCVGCSFIMDHIPHLGHLQSRETAFVAVAGASIEKINAVKERMQWKFPFYSTKDTFVDLEKRKEELSWKPASQEFFGIAVFSREGQEVFHTYSTSMRGVDVILSTYALLDMTPLGRQEEGNGMGNFKHHDKY
jgi:predicted dithiol-disulfide oxidoreductase (DUF899 family)